MVAASIGEKDEGDLVSLQVGEGRGSGGDSARAAEEDTVDARSESVERAES